MRGDRLVGEIDVDNDAINLVNGTDPNVLPNVNDVFSDVPEIEVAAFMSTANAVLANGNDQNVFLTAWMVLLDLTTGKMAILSAVSEGHVKIK